ncbi:hypothetical protein V5799_011846 [Amblyomma americanum]|uniref:Uncharacterized protein n=1 Tax=Amblyomma americanum TaxID=6943 RepID=A0AAQ4EFQ4_AMBAM
MDFAGLPPFPETEVLPFLEAPDQQTKHQASQHQDNSLQCSVLGAVSYRAASIPSDAATGSIRGQFRVPTLPPPRKQRRKQAKKYGQAVNSPAQAFASTPSNQLGNHFLADLYPAQCSVAAVPTSPSLQRVSAAEQIFATQHSVGNVSTSASQQAMSAAAQFFATTAKEGTERHLNNANNQERYSQLVYLHRDQVEASTVADRSRSQYSAAGVHQSPSLQGMSAAGQFFATTATEGTERHLNNANNQEKYSQRVDSSRDDTVATTVADSFRSQYSAVGVSPSPCLQRMSAAGQAFATTAMKGTERQLKNANNQQSYSQLIDSPRDDIVASIVADSFRSQYSAAGVSPSPSLQGMRAAGHVFAATAKRPERQPNANNQEGYSQVVDSPRDRIVASTVADSFRSQYRAAGVSPSPSLQGMSAAGQVFATTAEKGTKRHVKNANNQQRYSQLVDSLRDDTVATTVADSFRSQYSAAGVSPSPSLQGMSAAGHIFAATDKKGTKRHLKNADNPGRYSQLVESPRDLIVASTVADSFRSQYSAAGVSLYPSLQGKSAAGQVFATTAENGTKRHLTNANNQQRYSQLVDSLRDDTVATTVADSFCSQYSAAGVSPSPSLQGMSAAGHIFAATAKGPERQPNANDQERYSQLVDSPHDRIVASTVADSFRSQYSAAGVCPSPCLQGMSAAGQIFATTSKKGPKRHLNNANNQERYSQLVYLHRDQVEASTVADRSRSQYSAAGVHQSPSLQGMSAAGQFFATTATEGTERHLNNANNQEKYSQRVDSSRDDTVATTVADSFRSQYSAVGVSPSPCLQRMSAAGQAFATTAMKGTERQLKNANNQQSYSQLIDSPRDDIVASIVADSFRSQYSAAGVSPSPSLQGMRATGHVFAATAKRPERQPNANNQEGYSQVVDSPRDRIVASTVADSFRSQYRAAGVSPSPSLQGMSAAGQVFATTAEKGTKRHVKNANNQQRYSQLVDSLRDDTVATTVADSFRSQYSAAGVSPSPSLQGMSAAGHIFAATDKKGTKRHLKNADNPGRYSQLVESPRDLIVASTVADSFRSQYSAAGVSLYPSLQGKSAAGQVFATTAENGTKRHLTNANNQQRYSQLVDSLRDDTVATTVADSFCSQYSAAGVSPSPSLQGMSAAGHIFAATAKGPERQPNANDQERYSQLVDSPHDRIVASTVADSFRSQYSAAGVCPSPCLQGMSAAGQIFATTSKKGSKRHLKNANNQQRYSQLVAPPRYETVASTVADSFRSQYSAAGVSPSPCLQGMSAAGHIFAATATGPERQPNANNQEWYSQQVDSPRDRIVASTVADSFCSQYSAAGVSLSPSLQGKSAAGQVFAMTAENGTKRHLTNANNQQRYRQLVDSPRDDTVATTVADSFRSQYSAAGVSPSPSLHGMSAAGHIFAATAKGPERQPNANDQERYSQLVDSPHDRIVASTVADSFRSQYSAAGVCPSPCLQGMSAAGQIFATTAKKGSKRHLKNANNQQRYSQLVASPRYEIVASTVADSFRSQYSAAGVSPSPCLQGMSAAGHIFAATAKGAERQPNANNQQRYSQLIDSPRDRIVASTVADSFRSQYSAAGVFPSPCMQGMSAAGQISATTAKTGTKRHLKSANNQQRYSQLVDSPRDQIVASTVADSFRSQDNVAGVSPFPSLQGMSAADQIFATAAKKGTKRHLKSANNQQRYSQRVDSPRDQVLASTVADSFRSQYSVAGVSPSPSLQGMSAADQIFATAKKGTKRHLKSANNQQRYSQLVNSPRDQIVASTSADSYRSQCSAAGVSPSPSPQRMIAADQILATTDEKGTKRQPKNANNQERCSQLVDLRRDQVDASTVADRSRSQYSGAGVSPSPSLQGISAAGQVFATTAKKGPERQPKNANNVEAISTVASLRKIILAAQEYAPTVPNEAWRCRVNEAPQPQLSGLGAPSDVAANGAVGRENQLLMYRAVPDQGQGSVAYNDEIVTTTHVPPPKDGPGSGNQSPSIILEQNVGDYSSKGAVNNNVVSSLDGGTPQDDRLPPYVDLCMSLYSRPYFLMSDAPHSFVP